MHIHRVGGLAPVLMQPADQLWQDNHVHPRQEFAPLRCWLNLLRPDLTRRKIVGAVI